MRLHIAIFPVCSLRDSSVNHCTCPLLSLFFCEQTSSVQRPIHTKTKCVVCHTRPFGFRTITVATNPHSPPLPATVPAEVPGAAQRAAARRLLVPAPGVRRRRPLPHRPAPPPEGTCLWDPHPRERPPRGTRKPMHAHLYKARILFLVLRFVPVTSTPSTPSQPPSCLIWRVLLWEHRPSKATPKKNCSSQKHKNIKKYFSSRRFVPCVYMRFHMVFWGGTKISEFASVLFLKFGIWGVMQKVFHFPQCFVLPGRFCNQGGWFILGWGVLIFCGVYTSSPKLLGPWGGSRRAEVHFF